MPNVNRLRDKQKNGVLRFLKKGDGLGKTKKEEYR